MRLRSYCLAPDPPPHPRSAARSPSPPRCSAGSDCPASCARPRRRPPSAMAARPVAVRRPEISGRLQAVRLRQPERAQGRRGAPARHRHVRQFQPGGRRREGPDSRPASSYIYDTLIVRRSTRCRPSTACSPKRSSHPDDFSSVTYRLRAEAKWHDGKPVTPEDVIFSFEAFKKNSRSSRRLLPPRHQGGEDRRARGHLHVRRPGQSRTAADRRPAQRAAEALVGRHRRERQASATSPQTTLEPPLGCGAYRIKEFDARPHASSTSASRTTGARTCR